MTMLPHQTVLHSQEHLKWRLFQPLLALIVRHLWFEGGAD